MKKKRAVLSLEKQPPWKRRSFTAIPWKRNIKIWPHLALLASCFLSGAVLCQQLAHLAPSTKATAIGISSFPHPVPVKVKAIDNKTSLEKEEEAHVFLPHMVFSRLGSSTQHSLKKFWNAVEKSGDPKLSHHPMEKGWKRKNVPLFVHGDGVELQSRDSSLLGLWEAACPHGRLTCIWLPSQNLQLMLGLGPRFGSCWSGVLIALLGKASTQTRTLTAMPWKRTVLGIKTAGSLCKARFGASLGIMSFSPTISSWGTGLRHPCWENWPGASLQKDYKQICLGKQGFKVLTVAEHLSNPCTDHSLLHVQGVSSAMVRGDPLHILFFTVL